MRQKLDLACDLTEGYITQTNFFKAFLFERPGKVPESMEKRLIMKRGDHTINHFDMILSIMILRFQKDKSTFKATNSTLVQEKLIKLKRVEEASIH